MILDGRRIHLVGSAAGNCDPARLAYAHEVVVALVSELCRHGAAFLVPLGKEPLLAGQSVGPSIVFDWSVAHTVHTALVSGTVAAKGTSGRVIASLVTDKFPSQVPTSRLQLVADFKARDALDLRFLAPGWYAGAVLRQRQAMLGDIMIAVSGGQGTEHLADEYLDHGKPVIPLDFDLGSSMGDGSGGGHRMFGRALADPNRYFKASPGHSATTLFHQTRTHHGKRSPAEVATSIVDLLQALVPPRAFYVRLLNISHADFPLVEDFFRKQMDPFVKSLGYEPLQMGTGPNEYAWMNEAIFDSLHRSAVAVVDVTGLRVNCFMELGYALGRNIRTILTAREGTDFPFDAFALEAFLWIPGEDPAAARERLQLHWERNINMPKLVKLKTAG